MTSKDTMWKGIIEDFCVEFLHYFYASYIQYIDVERGFEFWDKRIEYVFSQ